MSVQSRAKDSIQQFGALILFGCCPLFTLLTLRYIVTAVTCHHTYSISQQIPALHGTANWILYTSCNNSSTAETKPTCYLALYCSLCTPCLSLSLRYIPLTLFFSFGRQKTMLLGNNSARDMVQCVYIPCIFPSGGKREKEGQRSKKKEKIVEDR